MCVSTVGIHTPTVGECVYCAGASRVAECPVTPMDYKGIIQTFSQTHTNQHTKMTTTLWNGFHLKYLSCEALCKMQKNLHICIFIAINRVRQASSVYAHTHDLQLGMWIKVWSQNSHAKKGCISSHSCFMRLVPTDLDPKLGTGELGSEWGYKNMKLYLSIFGWAL